MDTYINVLILVVLILLSGFFSASETALTAYRSNDLEKLDENKHGKKWSLLRQWLKDPNEMLTGLLIGNNIVNILASSIATVVVINHFGQKSSSVLLATALMTVLILIFGEITPKLIARNNASKISAGVIVIIYFISFIFKPVIYLLMLISKFIGRVLGINLTSSNIMITEEDIISFVNVGNAEGIIEEDEKEMIHSIVNLGQTSAKEVMTPRTSMLAFESKKTIDEVWDEIIDSGFSRIPVYKETIDDIVGVLYIKDIMKHIKSGNMSTPIGEIVRKGYYIPETKSIIEILKEFRSLQVHIAMVLDEYGGVVGLVTIEDLMEEIVGEIRDEYDDDEEEFYYKKIGEQEYEVDAMIDIETLNKDLEIFLPESEDYESLGGLIVTNLSKVCNIGDELTIGDIYLKVLEVDKMRVSKVFMKIITEKVGVYE
ncbi:MAG: HlyC/CorC family transporter [Fusobacterium sp.]|nr:HlyC/CorC family transporter [Fusobacterium sp.]